MILGCSILSKLSLHDLVFHLCESFLYSFVYWLALSPSWWWYWYDRIILSIKKVIIRKMFTSLQFPASSSDFTLVSLDLDSYKELSSALQDVLHGEANEQSSRYSNSIYHLRFCICPFSPLFFLMDCDFGVRYLTCYSPMITVCMKITWIR